MNMITFFAHGFHRRFAELFHCHIAYTQYKRFKKLRPSTYLTRCHKSEKHHNIIGDQLISAPLNKCIKTYGCFPPWKHTLKLLNEYRKKVFKSELCIS
eukprot:Gb_06607 [translate_table: standard]